MSVRAALLKSFRLQSGTKYLRLLRLTAWAVICLAASLEAQTTGDTVRIRVIDAQRRDPVPEAEIRWNGTPVGRTDGSGRIAFPRRSDAAGQLRITRLGFHTAEFDVPPGLNGFLDVELHAQPVSLSTLQVEAAANVRSDALKEFYRRVQTGGGRYFTRGDIDRARPRDVADLLRTLPGIEVYSNAEGDKPRIIGANPQMFRSPRHDKGECPILYYLDGTPFEPLRGMVGLDIRPQELEGIEVYRNGSTAPARYTRGQAVCGVILLWKRERI